MRVYSFYWAPGSFPHVYEKSVKLYDWARLNILDRFISMRHRKKLSTYFWPIFIIIFFLFTWQILWLYWWSDLNLTENDSIDEDINSKDCTNSKLLIQYSHGGYKPLHKITKLPTKEYKPGYCVRYNHWKIHEKYLKRDPSQIPILFAVHATPQYFKYLNKQLKTWDGLISLTLVVPYDLNNSEMDLFRMQTILEGLNRLKAVNNYDRVALHLLFEVEGDKDDCPDLLYNEPNKTTMWDANYASLMLRDFERLCASQLIYPINIARNIARLGVKTPLFVSGDIENIFSWNYERRMRLFAYKHLIQNNNTRLVLVHRRFEVDEQEIVPRTLSVLKMLYARKRVVVFHQHVFNVGHEIPLLISWLLKGKDSDDPTSIFITFNYYNEYWEPQYVTRNDETVPLHDESFPFRFRSNTHLGSELCRSGFKFAIVKDLFTVHRGIKMEERKEYVDFLQEESDSGRMQKIADAFMDRLDEMYPETAFDCPKQFKTFYWSRNFGAIDNTPRKLNMI